MDEYCRNRFHNAQHGDPVFRSECVMCLKHKVDKLETQLRAWKRRGRSSDSAEIARLSERVEALEIEIAARFALDTAPT